MRLSLRDLLAGNYFKVYSISPGLLLVETLGGAIKKIIYIIEVGIIVDDILVWFKNFMELLSESISLLFVGYTI
jgi:hypothetical protein